MHGPRRTPPARSGYGSQVRVLPRELRRSSCSNQFQTILTDRLRLRDGLGTGYVDPENLLFVGERIRDMPEVAPKVYETINTLDGKCAEVFRGHPFYEAPDIGQVLRRLVDSHDLKLTS